MYSQYRYNIMNFNKYVIVLSLRNGFYYWLCNSTQEENM